MSMVTKCPACGTTFRVTPLQLQAQHGMVRCGRCAHVFDGFTTLATLRDEAPPAVVRPPAPREESRAPDAAVSSPAEITPAFEIPLGTAPSEPAPSPQRQEPVPSQPQPVPMTAEIFAAGPGTRRRSGGWTFGVLLLLAALAAQGAYFYRSEIAAEAPEARPYLNKACELLRCTVALPQHPRQISIEASDMQATDPANPGVIALTATLRSNAKVSLGYPALDVVLTNAKDHTVARRIFLPAEYLGPGKDARAGIPPNAEVIVRLNLDTGNLGAAGFRLDLLAAPAR